MKKITTIDKIKLMMSYDLSKTLNENLGENNQILRPIEVDEQSAREVAKGLKTGLPEAEMIIKLASFFRVNTNAVKLALAKEASALSKELEKSIRNDIKSGVRVSTTNLLGNGAKESSKMLTIKEIMNSGPLTEKQIIDIIERNKNQAKEMARKIETKILSKPTTPTTPTTKPTASTTGIGSTVKKYTTEQFEKLKQFLNGKKKSWKETLLWAGGIGITATSLWYMFNNIGEKPNDLPKTPPEDNQWLPCIMDFINKKKGRVVTTKSGEISVFVQDKQYPKGIQFYSNGRVKDVLTGKMGTYKCKNGTIQQTNENVVNEQEVSNELANDVDKMIDFLDMPVSDKNLDDAYTLLSKYSNNGNGKQFLELYRTSGLGGSFGGSLRNSLRFIYDKGSALTKNKINKLINLYNNIVENKQTTSTTTPLSNSIDSVDIKWDTNPTTGSGTTERSKQSIYINCPGDNFPIKWGCRKSAKIKEVQKCLGMPPKYQTGNFGPKTLEMLRKNYNITKFLDETTYNEIISNCNKEDNDYKLNDNGVGFKNPLDSLPKYDQKSELKKTTDNASQMMPNVNLNQNTSDETNSISIIDKLSNEGKINGKLGDRKISLNPNATQDDANQLNTYLNNNGYIYNKNKRRWDRK